MEPQNNQELQSVNSGKGFLIASILLIAVVAAGAIYFWHERSVKNTTDAQEEIQGATLEINANLNATSTQEQQYDLDESNYSAS